MGKYRKRPVVIEAFKLFTGLHPPKWYIDAINRGIVRCEPGAIYIETLEGIFRAESGDWVIKGVKGELYPCKPDIFEQTYEEVQDA